MPGAAAAGGTRATGAAGSQRIVVTAGDSSHTKIVSRLEHVPG